MRVERKDLGHGAVLDCYLPDPAISRDTRLVRPAIVICPGGAFLRLAHREAEPIAMRWLGLGYDAFVCRYPVPDEGAPLGEGCYPRAVVALMRAVAAVKRNADAWSVDPGRVYALGCSAGGHVALNLAVAWDAPDLLREAEATAAETRPAAVVLAYPMVRATLVRDVEARCIASGDGAHAERQRRAVFGDREADAAAYAELDLVAQVRPDMPRVFVWQTARDRTLRASETAELVMRLLEEGVDCEFHLFQNGPHGMSLCDDTSAPDARYEDARAASWTGLAASWLALDGSPRTLQNCKLP